MTGIAELSWSKVKIGNKTLWVAESDGNTFWVSERKPHDPLPFLVTLPGKVEGGVFPTTLSCACWDSSRLVERFECLHIKAAKLHQSIKQSL